MGRIIILAGAPDAASLDWPAEEPDTARGPTREWQENYDGSVVTTDAIAFDHPQWRVVPQRAVANRAQALCSEAIGNAESSHQSQVSATDSPHVLYGRAEFMALTPATLESTRRSTQDAAIWQRGSFGHSATSFDEASMSICLPDALPETAQQLSRLHPTVVSQAADGYIDAATTSQEFLEYSLAVHEALPSSMPQIDLPNMPANDSFDETTQSFSQSTSFSLLSTVPPLPTDIPHWQPLTNLVDVPSASYLLSLAPQTVTVNLVVAIVSVGVPRVIDKNNGNRNSNNRRDRRPVSLVELVVGDETGSGFGLTIWMDGGGGQQQQTSKSSLAAVVPTLAPHDIVLFRHVALHVFGDKVYGSSLRKDQTKLHVLHRGRLSRQQEPEVSASDALFSPAHIAAAAHLRVKEDSGLPVAWQLLEKTARVRDWALQYVLVDGHRFDSGDGGASQNNPNGSNEEMRSKTTPAWMLPPADTQ